MAPWWSRPTAEGPEEGPESPQPAEPATPAPAEPPTDVAATTTAAAPSPPRQAAEPAASARTTTRRSAPKVPEALAPTPPSAAAPPAEGADVVVGVGADDESDETPAGEGAAEVVGAEPGVGERRPRRRRSGRGRGGDKAAAVAAATGEAHPPEPARAEREAEPRERQRPAPPARDEARPAAPREPGREAREPLRRDPRETREAGEAQALRDREHETMTFGVPQLQDLIREIIVSVPDRNTASYEERKLALFCDLENVALGARDSGTTFDINLVLERLLEKGKIIVKKAYADWNRYADYKRPFHENGIELIDIPQRSYSGKNSADIKMVVDAMDISYAKEHLDTFVLLSGDSDFSPLVSKLKENDKYVIGVGVKNSSSALLIDSCDEFIYYEDIWRDVERVPKLDSLAKKEQELFGLLIEVILALTRENKDVLWGSMIKQTMQRKRPSFNEGYYGYSTFSELLEDAERKSIVKLKRDQRSGSYIVTGFARRR
jgi:uncharacterized protein (TIGR00288 family)